MRAVDSDASDAEVIVRSLSRPEQFETIFDRYHDAIFAYVFRRAGRDAADDVLSDVFLAAFSGRHRFDPEYEVAGPWLYGIARNVLNRHWRMAKTSGRVLQSMQVELHSSRRLATDDAAELFAATEDWAVVSALLAGLNDGDREALLLYAWEELTYEQIALAMDIPVGTVRSRIHRARRILRNTLNETSTKENFR